jgi:hypothetical protein
MVPYVITFIVGSYMYVVSCMLYFWIVDSSCLESITPLSFFIYCHVLSPKCFRVCDVTAYVISTMSSLRYKYIILILVAS